jgi:hypothetical protein
VTALNKEATMRLASRLCAAVVPALLCAGTVQAQGNEGNIGIGVSLIQATITPDLGGGGTFGAVALGDIFVPIHFGQRFKLEPWLGVFRFKEKAESSGTTSDESTTQWRLGTGLYFRFPTSESFIPYFGPRVGLLFTSFSEEDTFTGGSNKFELSETDFQIGVALGGEYFFSRHFSLGGEVQLNYTSIGEPTIKQDGSEITDGSLSRNLISNAASILARFYF